ncbi:MAG: tRNA pseudouridine(38-40) synthase TruA [Gammaproteobacteria bacterium CG_4_10_14_0_8_um_filter_38_16]|nr:MAG: tRNA pseudouridine(38-40) synthase TruA [Gammaproteobacteria bacterium CG_4_10_14_0_8_um_filter_38_16]PJA03474.1 MAG: tRNA pseudouridine(38-40) synthase TruA [Gammaproteobacteria bacterium CG_4_10_14_0_2_um_filter_38_22]PJB10629.1 MAG: tRNA pseudouridine(38-40) synthase TruA [Gammaproteobacteria bacterium CG_4_9_14_3_um_filter_38_9]
MKRIALAVCYDGSRYHGWQHQEEVSSVQQTLEHALSRVAAQPITVICAGRTDAGVHASAQVVHFDTEAERTTRSWVFGANSNLPADISVLWAKQTQHDFHARFSALSRTYRYVICNQLVRPGILNKAVGWQYKNLDVQRMQQATQYLLGEHDFSAFRGSGCQAKHAIRTIYYLNVKKQGSLIVIEVKANAFLLHMVRNIVGVLVQIGEGEKNPDWAADVLHSRDRRNAGITSAPNGLYLVEIDYPAHFELPKMPKGPFFLD